jgi:hypothetical protein
MAFKKTSDGSYVSDKNGKLKIPSAPIKWPTPPGGVHRTPDGREIPLKPDGSFDEAAWEEQNRKKAG